MRVVYKLDVSDDYRRAVNHIHGEAGKATRARMLHYLQARIAADAEAAIKIWKDDPQVRRRRTLARIKAGNDLLGPDLIPKRLKLEVQS